VCFLVGLSVSRITQNVMDELNVKFLKGVAYAFVQETIDFIWGDFDPVPGIFFMSLPVLVAGAILF